MRSPPGAVQLALPVLRAASRLLARSRAEELANDADLRVRRPPDRPVASPGATTTRTNVDFGEREKLVKIRAKMVRHAKYVTFQMAEVAVPRELFTHILDRIQRFGVPPPLIQRG